MKKGYLNNFANWILDKLATKVYNQLATSNKTMIGALNELYSKRLCMQQVYRNGVWNDCNNIPIGKQQWYLVPRKTNLSEILHGLFSVWVQKKIR